MLLCIYIICSLYTLYWYWYTVTVTGCSRVQKLQFVFTMGGLLWDMFQGIGTALQSKEECRRLVGTVCEDARGDYII